MLNPELKQNSRWATGQTLAWLAVLLLIASLEVIFHSWIHGLQQKFLPAISASLLNTLIQWLLVTPWLLGIFLIICCLSARTGKWVLRIFVLLYLLLHLALTAYFWKAMVPLGADLFSYSRQDIRQTLGASGGVQWGMICIGILFLCLTWFLLGLAEKKVNMPAVAVIVIAGAGLILSVGGITGLHYGDSEFSRNLVTDKTGFFVRAARKHFEAPKNETDIYASEYLANDLPPDGGTARHYLAPSAYPFLRLDSAPDVLTPFLREDHRAPNIVIIIVEGLGRAFTNRDAYLGNFTPFLDSLAGQSLYWDNFLSAGGRTFAVLPSLLGSLPFARSGFTELGKAMPSSVNLVNVLKANGYHCSFYYGGDSRFDNMDIFLRRAGIDEVNDGASFPPVYTKIPAVNGFSWGYNDQELFRRWLDTRIDAADAPQLSVLLTLSMHNPFQLNEPLKYDRIFEARLAAMGLDEAAREERRRYKDQYASILYTDDALRTLFTALAKRRDFDHTVFLITGDHRMPEIPIRDKIDRYHVPLILYSPLLARKAKISSVSSHFDIAPSLLAWLRNTYRLQMPPAVTWMGDGLDTVRGFRNVHSYPLMQTKADLVDYIMGEDHLNGSYLFHLNPDLSETQTSDEAAVRRLSAAMASYRQKNEDMLRSGVLMPDSVYNYMNRGGPGQHH